MKKSVFFSLVFFAAAFASTVNTTEVVMLPSAANYGGGDVVGSKLIGRTYNGGSGPGIWIVADGGYRLYINGELLAEDNQAGRVTFVPYTFLPGENAVSVVGVNGSGAPGVMVQIDELEKSYYSGNSWYSKPVVYNAAWKEKGRDLSQWSSATALSYSSLNMPSGGILSGFAPNTQAKWIWTASESDSVAVLLFTFNIKAEGYGATVTGGEAGSIVFASDSASIRKALQSSDAATIVVPEGTYDFRQFRNAVTEATAAGRTWCTSACGTSDANYGKVPFYRIAFAKNDCSSLGSGLSIVSESAGLQSWSNWITTKPNKSLIGMGRGAYLRGASIVVRSYEGSGNHIYRNLAIYDVNPHLVEAGDGLETVGSSSNHVKKFWADHISYKWISDGMDMEYLDSATISYLDFDGRSDYNCWGTDPFMALVEDAQLTYANNYWHGTYGRVPKVTGEVSGSTVHLYNQYVDTNYFFIAGASGASSSVTAQVNYENSYINHSFGYLAEWASNGFVNFSNVTLSNTKTQYRYNNVVTSGTPVASVFTPSYSYVLRTVSTLPDSIPTYAGVGGRWGKMPVYDRAFGTSNKAPSISITTPSRDAEFDSAAMVTLTATAMDSDGTISRVDFYAGNTLVGTATSSPYTVTISDLASGTHSIRAIAVDNSGLETPSAFVTISINGGTTNMKTLDYATETKAAYYRIYDLQGRPLYAGKSRPAGIFPQKTVTVEFNASGCVIRRYTKGSSKNSFS